jgi:CyaY protein
MDTAIIEIARNKIKVEFTFRITIYQYSVECSMTESEFLALAESSLDEIELALDHASDVSDLDVECSRSGNVLEIEFVDSGAKIIVNSQAPMQELWVAAKSGGFHYKHVDGQWINTRDGSELFSALSQMVSRQSGVPVVLRAN